MQRYFRPPFILHFHVLIVLTFHMQVFVAHSLRRIFILLQYVYTCRLRFIVACSLRIRLGAPSFDSLCLRDCSITCIAHVTSHWFWHHPQNGQKSTDYWVHEMIIATAIWSTRMWFRMVAYWEIYEIYVTLPLYLCTSNLHHMMHKIRIKFVFHWHYKCTTFTLRLH